MAGAVGNGSQLRSGSHGIWDSRNRSVGRWPDTADKADRADLVPEQQAEAVTRLGDLWHLEADVDLILTHPTIGEKAWVQVKSGTPQKEFDDNLGRFRRDGSYDRRFFVCHSAAGALRLPAEPRLHLWTGEHL
jgi:hypothetical protein